MTCRFGHNKDLPANTLREDRGRLGISTAAALITIGEEIRRNDHVGMR